MEPIMHVIKLIYTEAWAEAASVKVISPITQFLNNSSALISLDIHFYK